MSTTWYVNNRIIIRPILKKTPYEIFKGRKTNISYFHIFGCKYFVLKNDKDNLVIYDDDEIIGDPTEDSTKVNNDDQIKDQEEHIQQEKNQEGLPQEWRTHKDYPID